MNRTTLTALALAGFTMTPLARAVQVGELESINGLGQPFEAFVPVIVGPDERLSTERIQIRPDAVSWSDPYQLDYLRGIEVEIVPTGSGTRYLRLVNRTPLEVPLLSFRLHLDAGRISFVRSFAVAPPPPVSMTAVARSATRPPARPGATDSRTITVRPGQTLSGIARSLAAERGGNWRTLMEALHRDNPGAFIGGDIDRLTAGATLTLPGAAPETTAEPAPRAPETADVAAARTEAVPPEATSATAASGRRTYDPAVRELIASSTARYAAIRARYATPASDAVNTQTPVPAPDVVAGPAPERAAEPGVTDAADSVAVSGTATAPEPLPVAAAKARPGPSAKPAATAPDAAPNGNETRATAPAAAADTIVPVTAEPSLAGMLVRLVAPLSLAAGLGVGIWVYRRRRVLASQRDAAAWAAAEAERRAQVAEKARAQSGDRAASTGTTVVGEAVEELDSTGDLVSFALQSIDDLIAHGRYESAEHDLKAVISRAPRNWQALLRLSEIYYITEKRPQFEAVAMELHAEHRAELPADDWAKLMRMGRVLIPENPLFGGPALVEARTA